MRGTILNQGSLKLPHLSIKREGNETVIAICDSELFGEEFREGGLKLKVERSFYEGEEVSAEEALEALKDATIANIVGSFVERAVEAGYVKSENVLEIEGIPHAQMARL